MRQGAQRYRSIATRLAVGGCLGLSAIQGVAQGPTAVGRDGDGDLVELARQQELRRLHQRIGRFVSGEAAVYTGELEAAEHRTGSRPEILPRSPVVASLTEGEALPGRRGPGVVLTVVWPGRELWLRLDQSPDEPGVTRTTRWRPVRASAGVSGSCRGCLGDLSERPRDLELHRLTAGGRLRDSLGTKFRVELSGRLERVPADALSLAELEVLEAGLEASLRDDGGPFTRHRGEGVQRVEGRLRQLVPPPPGSPPQTRCERVTRYSAERFVDLADLGRFGVRDLKILGTEVCCLDHDSHGGAEECFPEEAG